MANDLSHLDDLIATQDRGADLAITHPVTGESMPDVMFTIAGPDSDVARRARLKFDDEMLAFRGRPSSDDLDRMYVERLARCVVGCKIRRDGKDVPFTFTTVVKLLTSFQFIREQVDAFSQDRAPYFMRVLPRESEQ